MIEGGVVTKPGRHESLQVILDESWLVAAEVLPDGYIMLHCGGMRIEDMEALLAAAKAHLSTKENPA
jgi:hypothetical protein